jgi:Cu/Ag efflux pump CusA
MRTIVTNLYSYSVIGSGGVFALWLRECHSVLQRIGFIALFGIAV